MGHEAGAAQQPEVVSPFADVGHTELIDRFYESDCGDAAMGRELSIRILAHAGFEGDPSTTPLIGRTGKQVEQDGRPLVLADYINFAVKDPAVGHSQAVEELLDFLETTPGEPGYNATRSGIMGRLSIGTS